MINEGGGGKISPVGKFHAIIGGQVSTVLQNLLIWLKQVAFKPVFYFLVHPGDYFQPGSCIIDCPESNPVDVIKTGSWVKVDADKGVFEVS